MGGGGGGGCVEEEWGWSAGGGGVGGRGGGGGGVDHAEVIWGSQSGHQVIDCQQVDLLPVKHRAVRGIFHQVDSFSIVEFP